MGPQALAKALEVVAARPVRGSFSKPLRIERAAGATRRPIAADDLQVSVHFLVIAGEHIGACPGDSALGILDLIDDGCRSLEGCGF